MNQWPYDVNSNNQLLCRIPNLAVSRDSVAFWDKSLMSQTSVFAKLSLKENLIDYKLNFTMDVLIIQFWLFIAAYTGRNM